MKKSLLWIVVLVLSISMVAAFSLYGCKAEEAVAEEEVAEEEVAEEEVAEVTTGKPFEGITIWHFPGGSESCPYATCVYNGAKAAEEALGPTVTYVWSDWDPDKMITQFKEAVAAAPDGICIMGHPGETAFGPLIDDAISKGIIITTMDTQLPNIQAKYAAGGFGYAGADKYLAGKALAAQAVMEFGLGAGDKALVYGLLAQEGRGVRTQGCIDGLEDAGLTVDYLEISAEVNADASLGTPVITGYIAANPDVKLIITDHGAITSTVKAYAEAAGLEPGEVNFAGFDLSAASIDAIRSGYLGLVIDQQPWLQGYFSILQICLSEKYLFSGLNINTASGFINADNVEILAELAEEGIR